MAGKVKDLFVVLAEQHRSRVDASRRKDAGKDAGAAAESGGGGLVEAVKGAVKGLRREAPKRTGTKPVQRRELQRVPRGLLIPGWLLAAMVVLALGGGFAVGRATGGRAASETLAAKPGAERPEAFRDPSLVPGVLPPAEEEKELYRGLLYVLDAYPQEERAKAALLAQQLRAHELKDARIRFYQKGSKSLWLTVCYVASLSKKDEVLARIRELEGKLGFRADGELKDPYRKD